jgi:hypothetical protein
MNAENCWGKKVGVLKKPREATLSVYTERAVNPTAF